MTTIRIGTRRSALAMAQTRAVIDALRSADPSLEVVAVPLVTEGDRRAGSLAQVGGKGLFTRRLEEALDSGDVDLAVHSAKDMPVELDDRYVIAAVPPRADARDVLITPGGLWPGQLARGARIGTGSPRRAALLKQMQPQVEVIPLRGNVETRLGRVIGDQADLDGVILAAAGLIRLGVLDSLVDRAHMLNVAEFIPAGGQGALVVQACADRKNVLAMARTIEDDSSREALEAERGFLRGVGADCHSCVGVHALPSEGRWQCYTMVRDETSLDIVCACECGPTAAAAARKAASVVGRLCDRNEGGD